MRIRATKPEFWKSKRITSLSWEDRLLLKGMESYVDDNGVGVDDVELIVTDVFPRDMFTNPRETVARVSGGLQRLHEAGLVWRYDHKEDHLVYISFWEEFQRIDRPGKGRNPRPDGTWDYKESSIRECVASPRSTVAPGTGEQGNRGTEEQGNSKAQPSAPASYSSEFENFWASYPIKKAKRQAWKAWGSAIGRATPEQITAGALRYAQDPNRSDQYTQHGATWLNADGWEDEPLPQQGSTKRDNTIDAWGTPTDQTATDFIDGEVVEFRRALP